MAQVERLIADAPRLEAGVRALFTDLYELDELAHVTKDAAAFPQFTSGAIEDARADPAHHHRPPPGTAR